MRGRLLQIVLPISVLFAGALTLSACGQKGPLYLPGKKPAAAQEEAAAEEKVAKDKQEEDKQEDKQEEKNNSDGGTAK